MATRSPKTQLTGWRAMMRQSLLRSAGLIGAIVLGLLALFYGISVLSYDSEDPAFNSAAGELQHNWMGQPGAYMGDGALFLFGVPAIFLLPIFSRSII